MNLLEGSIAFALALAGLATLCTVLIEILHRLLRMRSDGLEKMLEGYYEAVIKPKLGDKASAALHKDLMSTLLTNPLRHKLDSRGPFSAIRQRLLTKTVVPTEEFLRLLPDTQAYRQLLQKAGTEAEELKKELAEKYDRFGTAASDYFKRRAQLLSLLVGILLALFGNIHAVRLFDTFVKNPDLAQRMQAQADNIRLALQHPAASAKEPTEPAPATVDHTVRQEFDQALATLRDYQALGLPIGWGYYPNCFDQDTRDPRCAAALRHAQGHNSAARENAGLGDSLALTARHDVTGFLLWLFTVVFTGLLIGLGGPFWFDLAVRLSAVRQALTGKKEIAPPAEDRT